MTLHFNEFEAPPALEDENIEDRTGCPIHKRIDAVCTEPGCPNSIAQSGIEGPVLSEAKGDRVPPHSRVRLEDCRLANELPPGSFKRGPGAARPVRQGPRPGRGTPVEIYQTQPKDRCVL